MTYFELIKLIPYSLSSKLRFVPSYAREQLFPGVNFRRFGQEHTERENRMREHIDGMSLILALHFLFSIYRRGYETVQETLNLLETQSIQSFRIGRATYSRGNEQSEAGRILSSGLLDCIEDAELKQVISAGLPAWEIVNFARERYGFGRID